MKSMYRVGDEVWLKENPPGLKRDERFKNCWGTIERVDNFEPALLIRPAGLHSGLWYYTSSVEEPFLAACREALNDT